MFSEPRINLIESDEGFSVEVLDRTHVRYTEGRRTVVVDAEVLVGEPAIAIHVSTIKHWDPPYDDKLIGKEAHGRMADNMRRAFRFTGHEIAVQ